MVNEFIYGRGSRIAFAVPVIVVLLGISGCTGEGSNSSSGDAQPVELRSDTAWESEFGLMVSVLGLNQGESQGLRIAFEDREAEVGAWIRGERGVKLAQLEGEMKAAAKNKDLAETKRTISAADPLRKELRNLVDSHEANILGSLTPERQIQWDGYKIAEKLLGLMALLALDATQQQQIRNAAVESISQAVWSGQVNPRAAGYLELEKWVENQLLSDSQYDAFQDLKKKSPMRSLGI